jgi:hypothetical protein
VYSSTVVLNIKLKSKLGTEIDKEICTAALDINIGYKLGTVLDREVSSFSILNLTPSWEQELIEKSSQ